MAVKTDTIAHSCLQPSGGSTMRQATKIKRWMMCRNSGETETESADVTSICCFIYKLKDNTCYFCHAGNEVDPKADKRQS